MSNGRKITYLDYAATTPMLPEVIEAVTEAERRFFGNASALHTPGHLALNEIEKAREALAELVGCEPEEIIFTSGASESNNTVMRTFMGCEIETSPLEHHSVLEAARVYRGEGNEVQGRPKLYSYMLANNETGEFLRLPEIDRTVVKNTVTGAGIENWDLFQVKDNWGHSLVTDRRREYLHSDLTQVLGKIPINVKQLGLDYATFSAHKIGGPLGVGALYVRKGVPFRPLIIGGLQEKGRRGSTYNTPGIVGFGTAVRRVLEMRPWEEFDKRVRRLRDRLAERILAEIPGVSLNTSLEPGASLPNILNASFKAAEGESIQLYLDAEGVIVSTGSACAAGDTQPSHVLMAKTGDAEVAHSSIRFSFGLDNTEADVERVMEVLPGIVERLQGMSTIR